MHLLSTLRARVLVASALLALGLSTVAFAAPPRKGAGFVGVTNQKSGVLSLPVAARVSPDGKKVTRFDLQWSSTCTDPNGRGTYGGLSVTLNKTIAPNGGFGDNGSFTKDFGGGTKGVFTVKLAGRFTKKTQASGTFNVKVAITDAAGNQIDTCDSGNVTWRVTD
jgi:hypothetical protein